MKTKNENVILGSLLVIACCFLGMVLVKFVQAVSIWYNAI